MFEAILDNTLVHQKDELRSKIASGQLAEAVTCLVFVQELWIEADYHYKGRELTDLILNELWTQYRNLHPRAFRQQERLEEVIEVANKLRKAFASAERTGRGMLVA